MATLLLASSNLLLSILLLSILLPAYDLTLALRGPEQAVIGGFHTPLERECLEILLRGSAPITIYPARTFDPARDSLYYQHPPFGAL